MTSLVELELLALSRAGKSAVWSWFAIAELSFMFVQSANSDKGGGLTQDADEERS